MQIIERSVFGQRNVVTLHSYKMNIHDFPIDVIEAWNLDFCLGNTVKYIARYGKKSDKVAEDLKKAAWYLNREIERMEHE